MCTKGVQTVSHNGNKIYRRFSLRRSRATQSASAMWISTARTASRWLSSCSCGIDGGQQFSLLHYRLHGHNHHRGCNMPGRTIARMEALCISAHRARIRIPGSLLCAYDETLGITGSVIVCLDGLAGVKGLHRGFVGRGDVEAVGRI